MSDKKKKKSALDKAYDQLKKGQNEGDYELKRVDKPKWTEEDKKKLKKMRDQMRALGLGRK